MYVWLYRVGEILNSQLVVLLIWLDGTMLFRGASTIILQDIGGNFQLFISIKKEMLMKKYYED